MKLHLELRRLQHLVLNCGREIGRLPMVIVTVRLSVVIPVRYLRLLCTLDANGRSRDRRNPAIGNGDRGHQTRYFDNIPD